MQVDSPDKIRNIAVAGQLSKIIDLTSLPEGIYFIKMAGSETTITRKLIIKR